MENDKPLISIVMAVYEPNLQWFKEQLDSLEAQTYPNLELLVMDDCSPTMPFETIQQYVAECIHSFPYQVDRNEKNLGSNLTFEKLTRLATGKYIAYCDQDDVWLPEKLSALVEKSKQTGATLICSDMYVIDGQGRRKADSITKMRRHHVFSSGGNLAEGLLFHNFVTGCTMLIDSVQAKNAIPFCPYMVHDHYLALWCAEHGSVQSVMKPLINYRIHGGNQTGLMAGVTDKQSYGVVRISQTVQRLQWLDEHFSCSKQTKHVIEDGVKWACARQENWNNGEQKAMVWRYRYFSKMPSLFEIFFRNIPESVFGFILSLTKNNQI